MESENNSLPENEVLIVEIPEVAVEVQAEEYSQPATNPHDARRRLNQLLSIPDRDRSDEEWDELNELEIQFAPGNRVGPDHGGHFRSMNDKQGRQQRGPQQGKPKQFQQKNKSQGQGQGGNPNHGQARQQNNAEGGQGQGGQGQHKQRRQKPHRNRQQGGQNGQPQGDSSASPTPAPSASEGPKSE